MLLLFPVVVYLAAATSIVVLTMLAAAGEMRRRSAIAVGAWFALAAYCQFFAASAVLAAVGLGLQTLLAIYLVLRWRLLAK